MNICMNEEICTNVCASMDGVRHCGVAYHTLCSSLIIFNASSTSSSSRSVGLTSRAGERGRRRGKGKGNNNTSAMRWLRTSRTLSKRKCIEHTRSAWVRNLLLKIGVGTLSDGNRCRDISFAKR